MDQLIGIEADVLDGDAAVLVVDGDRVDDLDAVLFSESYEERNNVLHQRPSRGQMIYKGEKVTLSVSRESYARWLPSIYQRSDVAGGNFVRDMLWITQHLFGSIEDLLDIVHTHFDPHEAPEAFLPWLAAWTAMVVDEDWPVEKKRGLIKKAIELYKIRGTVKGLKLFIALFTDHEPEILTRPADFRRRKVIRVERDNLHRIEAHGLAVI